MWLTYISSDKKSNQTIQVKINQVDEEDEEMVTNQDFTGYKQVKENGMDFLYSDDMQEIIFIKEDESKKLLVSILFNERGKNQ